MFWDARDIDPFYLEKPYPIHDISEWRVVEDGPLRATVEVVETIKTADDGDGLIVRMYEAHNQRGQVCLDFGRPVESAVEVDLLERETGPVTVEGNRVRCSVRPFEIKTLRVRL